jgi:hypothetical protein
MDALPHSGSVDIGGCSRIINKPLLGEIWKEAYRTYKFLPVFSIFTNSKEEK